MHDLTPTPALGAATQTIGTVTIAENTGVALASVAARNGGTEACAKVLKDVLGAVPDVGRTVLHDPEAGFWMGPDQWMIGAPMNTHEDIADQLKAKLGNAASVTEQSGAWVVFDVIGERMPDMCEILCNIPIRKMVAGDVRRTMIHQLGCFVIRRAADDHIRILGPRASAQSLHHALITAATSVA
ncbi:sarcosine oxidase subunit gamma [Octadecabacter sp. 1_MG-2023]|uniref:sarcosine oxidase subunit gamma n=1 Tax=unclassified Octadecabacter TaxID=196158 RepID=UPI001C08239A|nr:sarcosine oxidase subunit gamma [Octadecabacter sp. 1_MG-2023]MBU2991698.1 sarcosine oxidase subunit gamma [Octadecabacter sp. B2R22]MDO6735671.1 sarcosine oxidase subunit gamma [Octadecabacter sp. 1_MG-2023]